MMNHMLPVVIDEQFSTTVLRSHSKPKQLILFVHGFAGHAVESWNEFFDLVQSDAKFEESDVIFYGYDSLKTQTVNMSIRLERFVDEVLDKHNSPLRRGNTATRGFAYSKIVIVAHSLGAVVVRFALLRAVNMKKTWAKKCKVVLYAPAHHGSRVPSNFAGCFRGVLASFFKGLMLSKYPVISDLTIPSVLLTQLKNETMLAIKQKSGACMKANLVVFAAKERIVVNNTFCQDAQPVEIQNATHTTVCKPENSNSNEPFNLLVSVL